MSNAHFRVQSLLDSLSASHENPIHPRPRSDQRAVNQATHRKRGGSLRRVPTVLGPFRPVVSAPVQRANRCQTLLASLHNQTSKTIQRFGLGGHLS